MFFTICDQNIYFVHYDQYKFNALVDEVDCLQGRLKFATEKENLDAGCAAFSIILSFCFQNALAIRSSRTETEQ